MHAKRLDRVSLVAGEEITSSSSACAGPGAGAAADVGEGEPCREIALGVGFLWEFDLLCAAFLLLLSDD